MVNQQKLFGYMCLSSCLGAGWACANYELPRRATAVTTPSMPDCAVMATDRWDEADLLSELPIAALRIDSITVHKLHRLGVKTISQLWQLPRDGLASRLGDRLIQRSDQALGTLDEPIVALHANPDWSCQQSLEHRRGRSSY